MTVETPEAGWLRQWAEAGSEEAFSALVAQYVDLVHSAACRHVRNPSQAEEITQAVFIILARKAQGLGPGVHLGSWLYKTARMTAANFLRAEARRARREQEAYMQSQLNEAEPDPWEQIAPLLDAAMNILSKKEHDAIVIRYFEGKSLKEVGAALAVNENVARKRVDRALERLRQYFVRRGVAVTAASIAGAVGANSVQAAPAGVVATVAAAAKGAMVKASTLTLASQTIRLMLWLKLRWAVGLSILALALGGASVHFFHGSAASAVGGAPGLGDDLIVPLQRVGNLQPGMSAARVRVLLGAPDRDAGTLLEYRRFGLAVFLSSKGVAEIWGGNSAGYGGPLVAAFKARTKEGIGMGSSRSEVVLAFGQPTSTERLPLNEERLVYKPIGLSFALQNGTVHHIKVDLAPSK
jgi:RNA polymerase sigma factor (sigma-70 family)